jgi:hypothetical protein
MTSSECCLSRNNRCYRTPGQRQLGRKESLLRPYRFLLAGIPSPDAGNGRAGSNGRGRQPADSIIALAAHAGGKAAQPGRRHGRLPHKSPFGRKDLDGVLSKDTWRCDPRSQPVSIQLWKRARRLVRGVTAAWNSRVFARWPIRPWPSSPGRPWTPTAFPRCARTRCPRPRAVTGDESESGCSLDPWD